MVKGLALEGGGAKGAYQAGVYKALEEAGYTFDYVVGTSIGAINGVMIVQNKTDLLIDLWRNVKYSLVVDVDDDKLYRFLNDELSLDNARDKLEFISEVVKNKGFDISPMVDLIDQFVDEDLVRNSNMTFGLNFVYVNDLSNMDLFIDDIPKGGLTDMLTYTAMLPIFKQPQDKEYYLDGGVYRNNPYPMIIDKCDKVINVLLYPDRVTKAMRDNPKLDIIMPSEKLPSLMDFNPTSADYALKLGYYDGLRYVRKLEGKKYYIEPITDMRAERILSNWQKDTVEAQDIISKLSIDFNKLYMKGKQIIKNDIKDIVIEELETIATKVQLEKFKIYSIEKMAEEILSSSNISDLDNREIHLVKSILK